MASASPLRPNSDGVRLFREVSTHHLTLWGIGTPRTMRVHWMLEEYGLEFDFHPIGPRTGETRSPEFLALTRKHKIPVLQHDDFILTESAATVAYISDAFEAPDGFFVPEDNVRRAKLNELCHFVMTELDALSLHVIRRHADLSEIYGEAPNAVQAARESAIVAAPATDMSAWVSRVMNERRLILLSSSNLETSNIWSSSVCETHCPDHEEKSCTGNRHFSSSRQPLPGNLPWQRPIIDFNQTYLEINLPT
jgi:hypothetical protein